MPAEPAAPGDGERRAAPGRHAVRRDIVKVDREQMVRILIEEFPSLEEEIRDDVWAGLVHLEIGCFARYTQRQIDGGNREEVQRCFAVADRILKNADEQVDNAVYVSYLEHLDLHDGKRQRSWAKGMMSPLVLAGWKQMNE